MNLFHPRLRFCAMGVVLLSACGDDDASSTSGSDGGASPTSSDTSTTSDGGGGGTTNTSTTSGDGGGTGGSSPCLDPSTYAALFTISADDYCAVAVYDADERLTPSWGAHGGPLSIRLNGDQSVDLVRWTVPAGPTGHLTKEEKNIGAVNGAGTFLGETAVDLPFFGWTALSWSGAFPNTAGEIVMVKDGAITKRFPVNAPFSLDGLGADDAHGRLLYSGFSKISDAGANANVLYAADACGTAQSPDLLPGNDPMCASPVMIAAWGDASGPLAIDHDGNAFATMPSFSGTQEIRGFAADTVTRGKGATMGTTLSTVPGFGASLIAVAPTGATPGLLVFQPHDPQTFDPLDVTSLAYTATPTEVKADGLPKTMLKIAGPNVELSLMKHKQEQIWVSQRSTGATTFVVLARAR